MKLLDFAVLPRLMVILLPWSPATALASQFGQSPLETFNHAVFDFNNRVGAAWESLTDWAVNPDGAADEAGSGLRNIVSNLINEPITIASGLIAANLKYAGNAAARFAINSTVGLGGYFDSAADLGLPARHSDLGGALCAYGVPDGPYVVVPLFGPRTVRDGFVDLVVVNALLFYALSKAAGPSAALALVLGAETVGVYADAIAFMPVRPIPLGVAQSDFDTTRSTYLEQRRTVCDDLRTGG